mmetsp:Transcript_11300/g.32462  ORF Transcript_11300/g.32462 Transcript_11300/m.32462 type:complete len:200 (+) Transcript_11300:28-627(+)
MTTTNNDETTELTESTINWMVQHDGSCIHPIHYHTFQGSSRFSLFSSQQHKCIGCQKMIQQNKVSLLFDTNNNTILQCVACGAYAHRHCALSQSSKESWKDKQCPVNLQILQEKNDNDRPKNAITNPMNAGSRFSIPAWTAKLRQSLIVASFLKSGNDRFHEEEDGDDDKQRAAHGNNSNEDSHSWRWSAAGPPQHWAR